MKRVLRDDRGETLVETLVSIVVLLLTCAFLITSISAAVKINAKASDIATTFVYSDDVLKTENVTVKESGVSDNSISVKLYESNGYYYYRK